MPEAREPDLLCRVVGHRYVVVTVPDTDATAESGGYLFRCKHCGAIQRVAGLGGADPPWGSPAAG